jgi:hypothetical protein
MYRSIVSTALLTAAMVGGALIHDASAADVHVGINVGIPAPPAIVVPSPPRLVVVPSTPAVQYAPDVGANFFFYGGQYYTYDNGAWFIASAYNGPWVYAPRVPRPLLIVPARYYHAPPRYYGGHRRYYRGHGHDHHDDHHHDHGHGDHGHHH